MPEQPVHPPAVGALILAAGEAKRAGGPKAVWPVRGRPSVRRVAEAALGAEEISRTVVVVGGPWAEAVVGALRGLDLTITRNANYALGQSSSIKCGLAALGPHFDAAVFLLADQPFLTSQIIDDLLKFHLSRKAAVSAPGRQGARLNPVVFDLGRFREDLMNLSGDTGGREIVKAAQNELALWPAEQLDPKCFLDFDTGEEYERLNSD